MMLMGWTAIGLAVILVGGTLYGYVKYRNVLDGINTEAISPSGHETAEAEQRVEHSRDRLGQPVRTQRQDRRVRPRAALGHGDDRAPFAGGGRATVLSFPRDSAVPVYSCPSEPGGFPGQTAAPGSIEQLNASFSNGGANCLWKTIEHTTGIHLDNFVQLNFTGFISVINAIGGVPVCLPTAIRKTRYDRLKLKAGPHVLKGYKALQFWRLRDGFGLRLGPAADPA